MLCCSLLLQSSAQAGDEDIKGNKKKPQPLEELAPPVETKQTESPDLSLGAQPPPIFDAPMDAAPNNPIAAPAPNRRRAPWMPDKNIDFSELYDTLELPSLGDGILPPALGFRGYRPNMVAVSYGDRTPGIGGMIEYSWNRIGAGITGSYRQQNSTVTNPVTSTAVTVGKQQSFVGVYGLYRWLPFAVSPYFLLGVEGAYNTFEPFGGMAGIGIEANVHLGWTILLGYTFHSTIRDGSMGGALGWSF